MLIETWAPTSVLVYLFCATSCGSGRMFLIRVFNATALSQPAAKGQARTRCRELIHCIPTWAIMLVYFGRSVRARSLSANLFRSQLSFRDGRSSPCELSETTVANVTCPRSAPLWHLLFDKPSTTGRAIRKTCNSRQLQTTPQSWGS